MSAQNISHLRSLRILSLPSNRIAALPGADDDGDNDDNDAIEGRVPLDLPSLAELYLSHNALTVLPARSLSRLPALTTLDLSGNAIERLAGLAGPDRVPLLEEFWFSGNRLSGPGAFADIERELAGKRKLGTVYFEGNPFEREAGATYRNKIKLALPQIVQIDATFVRPG